MQYHFAKIFIANYHFQRKDKKDKSLHIFSLNLKLYMVQLFPATGKRSSFLCPSFKFCIIFIIGSAGLIFLYFRLIPVVLSKEI